MHSNQTRRCSRSSDGYVVPVAVLLALAMVGIAALSIDAGRALYRRFQIQTAADAASLAGAIPLGRLEPNDHVVRDTVEDYAAKNAIDLGIELDGVECGIWDGRDRTFKPCSPSAGGPGGGVFNGDNKKVDWGNFTDTADSVEGTLATECQNCGDIRANALRVKAHHREPTIFGRLFGIEALSPTVTSVTIYVPGQMKVRPLGVPDDVIEAAVPLDPTDPLDPPRFQLRRVSPGNWGKVDIGLLCIPVPPATTCVEPGGGSGQMQGLPDFSEKMLQGVVFKRDPAIGPNPAYPSGGILTGEAPAVQGFSGLQETTGLKEDDVVDTAINEERAPKTVREALCELDPVECYSVDDGGHGGPSIVIPVVDHTRYTDPPGAFPNGNSNAGRVTVLRWALIRWMEPCPDDPPSGGPNGRNWCEEFQVVQDPYLFPNSVLPVRKLVD